MSKHWNTTNNLKRLQGKIEETRTIIRSVVSKVNGAAVVPSTVDYIYIPKDYVWVTFPGSITVLSADEEEIHFVVLNDRAKDLIGGEPVRSYGKFSIPRSLLAMSTWDLAKDVRSRSWAMKEDELESELIRMRIDLDERKLAAKYETIALAQLERRIPAMEQQIRRRNFTEARARREAATHGQEQ